MSLLVKSAWLFLCISTFLVNSPEGGVKDTQDRPLAPVQQEESLAIDEEKKNRSRQRLDHDVDTVKPLRHRLGWWQQWFSLGPSQVSD